ncbi:hypothetical protein [Bacillus sp. JCM 19041]|uniref:hypothetical protein n=1 Tax=Bacillus sp. JCM 19041 TaxID=1460637 RepID=UPI0006CFD0C4
MSNTQEEFELVKARLEACESTISHLVDESAKANAKIDALLGVIRTISTMKDEHFIQDATAILEVNGDLYRADALGLTLEEYKSTKK